jgi:orotidine-5'-phosphate decarboxylase
MQPKDRIFVSIDVDTIDEAKWLMDQCVGLVTNIKFGLQLATWESWRSGIAEAHERGFKVFCDAKFKDIPNTLEHAAYSLSRHQPDYFTVMADNNLEALRAVQRGTDAAVDKFGLAAKPTIIGVTVLTSITPAESLEIYGGTAAEKTLLFAGNAVEAGLGAIVCSSEEVSLLKADKRFRDTLLITPGIRPAWAVSNDQSRTTTPAQAIKQGADMLVIGRPITQSPPSIGSVRAAVERIISEIEEALA